MTITRPAPVLCPHCRNPLTVQWSNNATLAHLVFCDRCPWAVNFKHIRLNRIANTARLRRLATINRRASYTPPLTPATEGQGSQATDGRPQTAGVGDSLPGPT